MQKIEPPDTHHLLAASGWIDLGNYAEADAELDRISPNFRVHSDVLTLRWHIYAAAQKWEAAADIGRALRTSAPDDPAGWIQAAYALRRSSRMREAFDTLLEAETMFPKCEIIHYNLACYAAQSGELERAKVFLGRAFKVGNRADLESMALDDSDLKPLWKEIGEL